MSFDPTIALIDYSGDEIPFVKIYDDAQGAYRQDSTSVKPTVRALDVKHTSAPDKDKDVIDRHLVAIREIVRDSTSGALKAGGVNVTFFNDQNGVVTEGKIFDMFNLVGSFFFEIVSGRVVVKAAVVQALMRGER